MTMTEAKRLLNAFAEAQCNTTIHQKPRRCACSLQTAHGLSRHFDDDVTQVVARAIRDVLGERLDLAMDDYEGAALVLLEEGLTQWKVPARQAHRQVEWLDACHRELMGYVKGVQA